MVGNRVFGQSLILCVAASLLFAPWGSYRIEPGDAVDALPKTLNSSTGAHSTRLASGDRLVHGMEGHVSIGQVKIAYWTIVALVAFGSVTAIFNWLRWTRLSSILTFACFGMAAACSLVSVIDFSINGQVGAGSVLALICALAGIAFSPGDEPQNGVQVPRIEATRRQTRRAA